MGDPTEGDRQLWLNDDRVVHARDVRATDTALFLDFFARVSPPNRQFMRGCTFDRDLAETITQGWDDPNWYRLVAVDSSPPAERIVGYSWIHPVHGERPFLGIGIADAFANAGLGKGLLRLMIRDAARRLHLPRFWLGVFVDNTRARHVYAAVGFREDPTLPSQEFNGRTEIYMVAPPAPDYPQG
ncbi:GNAT family N-acetyltransferase, partial [bacterium]|nr:GNAT family N-acetyltransferase [bacterium]